MPTYNRPRRYRIPTLFMLTLNLTACHTWQPVPVSPREFLEEEKPTTVRIIRADGSSVVLSHPKIENDSISGSQKRCQWSDVDLGQVCRTIPGSVAFDDVSILEALRFGPGRTIGAIFFGLGVGAAVIAGGLSMGCC